MNDRPADAGNGQPLVLVIGKQTAEFSQIAAELRQEFDRQRLTRIDTPDGIGTVHSGRSYDLVVVLQEWPEQYTTSEVFGLLNRFPLARLVVCYGAWCDSDGRSRELWPLGSRVSVASAVLRIRHELAVIRGVDPPLPLTANRADTFAFDTSIPVSQTIRPCTIGLRTPDPGIRSLLTAMLAGVGHTIAIGQDATPELLIWDVDPWSADTAVDIARFADESPRCPIVAWGGFLRTDTRRQLERAGVTGIVSKLAPLVELIRAVGCVLDDVSSLGRQLASSAASAGQS